MLIYLHANLIKSPITVHFIRFSIEWYKFIAHKRRYSEKPYKVC